MAVRKSEDAQASKKKITKEKRVSNTLLFLGTVVILVITIVSFVLVPAVDFSRGTGRLVFGKYANRDIQFTAGNYFSQQRDALNNQIKAQGTDTFSYQMQAYQVWRGAFERTVIREAALYEAEKAGVFVSEGKLDSLMAEYPAFMDNGKFSVERYRSVATTDKARIRNNLRDDTITALYFTDLFDVKTTSKETAFVKSMASPQRSFKLVSLAYTAYPDSEVTAFATQNASLFRRIKLSRVSATTEKEAQTLLASLRDKKTTFAEAVKAHSSDTYASKGGDMGFQFSNELEKLLAQKDDAKKILALARDAYSDPIKGAGDSGWSIYRCDEGAAAPDLKNADIMKSVRSYIERYEKGKIEDYFVKRGNEFITAAKTDYAKACSVFGLKSIDVPSFPINLGDAELFGKVNPSGIAEMSSVTSDQKILTALFSAKDGGFTEPLITDSSVLVFKVTGETTADASALDTVESYFPYIVQQYTDGAIVNYFLRSDKLKDNFSAVFFKYFMPTDTQSK